MEDVLEKEVVWGGFKATLRTAKTNHHHCRVSNRAIDKGDKYYSIVIFNTGLRGMIYPARVLPEYLKDYMERYQQ